MFKIYKIIDNTNDNVYIGQTKKKYLGDRISGHRGDFKRSRNCSSSIILKNNDWYYELIEETDDINREKYWINNTPNCINERKMCYGRGNRDKNNYNEWKKNYRKKNKQKIKEIEKERTIWRSKKRLQLVCDTIDMLNEY